MSNTKWGHLSEQEAFLKNMFESITLDQEYAMCVLDLDYKLY